MNEKEQAWADHERRESQRERLVSVPPNVWDLAQRRTKHIASDAEWKPAQEMIAQAYLLGLSDGHDANG